MESSSSSLSRPAAWTASRCIQETARGTHAFTVDGYSLHRGLGGGEYINSAVFSVGGYDWCIRYYPEDDSESETDGELCICIFLQLMSKGSGVEVRALYSFRLLNHETGKSELIYTTNTPQVFDGDVGGTGFASSCSGAEIKRCELEASSEYLRDDRLVIECDLTVFKRSLVKREQAITAIHKKPSSSPSNFSKDMIRMMKDKVGTDVSFEVGGEIFAAHRVVLAARSSVFNAELYGPMRATAEQQIAIQDMLPSVFKELLHFMYTDFLSSDIADLGRDDSMEMIKHLLEAADRYAVEKLKTMCENSLCKRICVENVLNTFALADQHNCHKLKDACAQFITSSSGLDDVIASKGYGLLKRSCPVLLLDVFERATKSRKII
uniref:BTB domain-containing protein n=1 Tax=Oryza punctata TaxID=4537 RepID=A0A0E0LSJ5_ORYPU